MTCKFANSQHHRLLGQGSHPRPRCVRAAVIAFQALTAQSNIQIPAVTTQINHSSGETVVAIADIVQNGYKQLDAKAIKNLSRHLNSLFEEVSINSNCMFLAALEGRWASAAVACQHGI
jgi:hypothetical protein